MTRVLGVDGGGTRVRAVVIDGDGTELGRGEAAGVVVTVEDAGRAADGVAKAVGRALDRAGADPPVDALWAGLAGAGSPSARDAVHRALAERDIAGRIVVGTDVEAAFHDAFETGVGVMLIAGTGSIAWGRAASGEVVRVGGWGRLVGDEGSGHALGLSALRRVLQAEDGRAGPTALRAELLAALGLDAADELVTWVAGASKGEIAALAPIVVGSAELGDREAASLVQAAVFDLRRHVATAIERMRAKGTVDVVLWGGLIAPRGPLRARVVEALSDLGVRIVDRELDPAMGAARMALAALDDAPSD